VTGMTLSWKTLSNELLSNDFKQTIYVEREFH